MAAGFSKCANIYKMTLSINGKASNLSEFINDKGFITKEVNDKGILMDVDTIEDYEYACKHIGF